MRVVIGSRDPCTRYFIASRSVVGFGAVFLVEQVSIGQAFGTVSGRETGPNADRYGRRRLACCLLHEDDHRNRAYWPMTLLPCSCLRRVLDWIGCVNVHSVEFV